VRLAANSVVRKEVLVVGVEKAVIYDLVDLTVFLEFLRKSFIRINFNLLNSGIMFAKIAEINFNYEYFKSSKSSNKNIHGQHEFQFR